MADNTKGMDIGSRASKTKRKFPDWSYARGFQAKEKKPESTPCINPGVLTTEYLCASKYVPEDEEEDESSVNDEEERLECIFCGTKGSGENIRTYDEDSFDAQKLCGACAESFRTDWLGDGVENAPKLHKV